MYFTIFFLYDHFLKQYLSTFQDVSLDAVIIFK